MKLTRHRFVYGAALLLLLALAALSGSGCATTETDNLSSRPWNSPRGWETGLPSMLNEGR
jgi:hypothetical protein